MFKLPSLQGRPKDYKASFDRARWGNRCSSQHFVSAVLPDWTTWREAIETPDGSWRIREFRRGPNTDQLDIKGKYLIEVKTITDKLSFFDAIRSLSVYEKGQLAMHFLPAEGKTTHDLGLLHFIAFAEREGIAFDTKLNPHPTYNGEVIEGEGAFDEGALNRARGAFRRAAIAPDVLGGLFSKTLAGVSFGVVESFVSQMKSASDVDLLIKNLESLASTYRDLQAGFLREPAYARGFLNHLQSLISSKQTPAKVSLLAAWNENDSWKYQSLADFVNALSRVEKSIQSNESLSEEQKSEFRLVIPQMTLHTIVMTACFTMKSFRSSSNANSIPNEETLSAFVKIFDVVKGSFLEAGGQEDDLDLLNALVMQGDTSFFTGITKRAKSEFVEYKRPELLNRLDALLHAESLHEDVAVPKTPEFLADLIKGLKAQRTLLLNGALDGAARVMHRHIDDTIV